MLDLSRTYIYNTFDCVQHPEVTDINRHNFITELSKLLTFMYEEDRLTAVNMYEDMFESCPDEQQLIHHLVSPTRQAVVLARSYDSKERMLHVDTRTKKSDLYVEEEDIVPAFVLAIEKIGNEVRQLFGTKAAALPVSEDQFSLFPAADGASDIPTVGEIIGETAENEAFAPAAGDGADVPGGEIVPVEESSGDSVDEFLSEYENGAAITYREETLPEEPSYQDAPRVRSIRRERSVPLLILYSLAAIPVCLVGLVLLLVPTLISLVFAFVFAAAGIAAVSCAFGSFVIFADILVVLGAGLVLLALGLLFLWLFVWFIGGAIAGMINGAIKLGNRLCTKEVAA